MAPKKPKKPSSLQRQRQLRAQQQQVKRASSKTLPPGKKGGAVAKPKATKPTATSKPSPVEKVRVRDLGPTKPKLSGTSQRALPPGTKGGSLARGGAAKGGGLAKAGGAAAKAGGLGRVLGAAGAALGIPLAIKNIKDVADQNKRWDAYKERSGLKQKPNNTQRTGQGGKTKPAAKPAAKPANVADYKDGTGNVYDGNSGRLKTAAKPKPKATAAPKAPAKPKPAPKGSSSASKTSRNVGPVANGEDYARNKDPKKYNPLMQKTFGYQTGDAPDQRAKRANYAGKDTGVSPKSTGSKNYADKKATNKTTTAFASDVNLSPNKKKLKAKR